MNERSFFELEKQGLQIAGLCGSLSVTLPAGGSQMMADNLLLVAMELAAQLGQAARQPRKIAFIILEQALCTCTRLSRLLLHLDPYSTCRPLFLKLVQLSDETERCILRCLQDITANGLVVTEANDLLMPGLLLATVTA